MKINIESNQTGHLMTDLGIKSERCEELCGIISSSIEELHDEGKNEVTLAQVLQKAAEHAKDYNELAFIGVTAGEFHAQYKRFRAQAEGSASLTDMLAQVFQMTNQQVGQHN